MKDLITRLEKATGPDRELDADIHAAVTGGKCSVILENYPPPYTAFVSSAIGLVPKGMWWSAQTYHDEDSKLLGSAACGEEDEDGVPFDAETPAIALCGAALRAREAMPQAARETPAGKGGQ